MKLTVGTTSIGRAVKRGLTKIRERRRSQSSDPDDQLEDIEQGRPWLRKFSSDPSLRTRSRAQPSERSSRSRARSRSPNHHPSMQHSLPTRSRRRPSPSSCYQTVPSRRPRSPKPNPHSLHSTCSSTLTASATTASAPTGRQSRRKRRPGASSVRFSQEISYRSPPIPRNSKHAKTKSKQYSIRFVDYVPAPFGIAYTGPLPPSHPGRVPVVIHALFQPFALLVEACVQSITVEDVAAFVKKAFNCHPVMTVKVSIGSMITEESIVTKDAVLRQYLLRTDLERLELRVVPSHLPLPPTRPLSTSRSQTVLTSHSVLPPTPLPTDRPPGLGHSSYWRMPRGLSDLYLQVLDKPSDESCRRNSGFQHPQKIVEAAERLLGHVDDKGNPTAAYNRQAVVHFLSRYDSAQVWGMLGAAALST